MVIPIKNMEVPPMPQEISSLILPSITYSHFPFFGDFDSDACEYPCLASRQWPVVLQKLQCTCTCYFLTNSKSLSHL